MSKTENNRDQWARCPPGMLTEQATKIRRAKMKRHAAIAGCGLAVVLVAAGSQMITRISDPTTNGSGYQEPNYGGVTCTVVRRNVADYKAGHLSGEMCESMEEHVRKCSICSGLLASMSQSVPNPFLLAQQ